MANEVVVATIKPPWPQWRTGKQKAANKTTPPPSSKRCSKCGTLHKPENSCFIDTKDLVCAGCGKHGHAHHACSLVTVQTIAVVEATPLVVPSWQPRVPRIYLEDMSSNDNFFADLHPKVMPLLKVCICYGKGQFVYPSFPDSSSTISLASLELTWGSGLRYQRHQHPSPVNCCQWQTSPSGWHGPVVDRHSTLQQLHLDHCHCLPQHKGRHPPWLPRSLQSGVISKDFPSSPSFICQHCHRGFIGKEDGGAYDFGHSVSSDHRCSVSSDKVHLKANNQCSESSVYAAKVIGHQILTN